MPDNCPPKQLLVSAPVGSEHAAGVHKRAWTDVVSKDLRLCKLSRTWREEAQECLSLSATIKHSIGVLYKQAEVNEKSHKHETK